MESGDPYEFGVGSGGGSRRRYDGASTSGAALASGAPLPSGRPPFRRTSQPGRRPSPGSGDGDGGAQEGGRLPRSASGATLKKPTQDDTAEAEALLAAADGNGQKAGEALIAAIRDGKTGVVHELLAAGVPVKTRARVDGSTALHAACARGATHTATMLIARDAPLSATDGAGWAPLHTAAFHGHANVLRKLLEAGADAGAIELQHNKTALHWCVPVAKTAARRAVGTRLRQNRVCFPVAPPSCSHRSPSRRLGAQGGAEWPPRVRCAAAGGRRRG